MKEGTMQQPLGTAPGRGWLRAGLGGLSLFAFGVLAGPLAAAGSVGSPSGQAQEEPLRVNLLELRWGSPQEKGANLGEGEDGGAAVQAAPPHTLAPAQAGLSASPALGETRMEGRPGGAPVSVSALGEGAQQGGAPQTVSPVRVCVVPIQGPIDPSQQAALLKGVQTAAEQEAQVLLLEVNTQGGSIEVALEMLKLLEGFKGQTLALINREALSAGALIASATERIYMHPKAVVGAAGLVSMNGYDLPPTVRLKVESYLKARLRALWGNQPKGQARLTVLRAMIEPAFELRLGKRILKPVGELLSLTAQEALEPIGPGQTLWASGIAGSVDELLNLLYGKRGYEKMMPQPSRLDQLGAVLSPWVPLLLVLGFLCFFLELKMKGTGVFGVLGLLLFGAVFLGQYAGGLVGYATVGAFVLGLGLLMVELVWVPGSFVLGVLGLGLMWGALAWVLADFSSGFSWNALLWAFSKVMGAFGLAWVGFMLVLHRFPGFALWDGMVLRTQNQEAAVSVQPAAAPVRIPLPLGAHVQAMTHLSPAGQVRLPGEGQVCYPALSQGGFVSRGEMVRVIGYRDFEVLVEPLGPQREGEETPQG